VVICIVSGMGHGARWYGLMIVWLFSGVVVDCVDVIDTSPSA